MLTPGTGLLDQPTCLKETVQDPTHFTKTIPASRRDTHKPLHPGADPTVVRSVMQLRRTEHLLDVTKTQAGTSSSLGRMWRGPHYWEGTVICKTIPIAFFKDQTHNYI